MKYSTILVTGCGGDIGSGIGRILRSYGIADRLIGCDVHSDHPGTLLFDVCESVVRAGHPEYIASMERIIREHDVKLIIPTAEPELRFLASAGLFDTFADIPLIMANSKAVCIGYDKLQTSDFLRTSNLPFPWSCMVGSGLPPHTPCIVKDRYGAGSKHVAVVKDEMIPYYLHNHPEYIWQEYLIPDDEEYTCGLYRTMKGEVRTICFKRKLQGGFTGSGVVIENSDIDQLLHSVAVALDLRGSINVQLRLCERGPVIFEINPRFSSTVVFRHLLGFKDLIWSVEEKAGKSPDKYNAPVKGARIYRGSFEYIIEDSKLERQVS